MNNKQTFLSTLWIFATFNYLYCDLIGLMDASLLKQYLTGRVDGLQIDATFLLYAGVLMELPISMIVLSRWLKPKFNATANMIAALIKTAVMVATLFVGTPTIYYLFFATIEIATTAFIFLYAFKWFKQVRVASLPA